MSEAIKNIGITGAEGHIGTVLRRELSATHNIRLIFAPLLYILPHFLQ